MKRHVNKLILCTLISVHIHSVACESCLYIRETDGLALAVAEPKVFGSSGGGEEEGQVQQITLHDPLTSPSGAKVTSFFTWFMGAASYSKLSGRSLSIPDVDTKENMYGVAAAGIIAFTLALTFVGCMFFRRTDNQSSHVAAAAPRSKSSRQLQETDEGLAQSTAMFHYQSQKKNMKSLPVHTSLDRALSADSSGESGDEGPGGDTVFECAGLAPATGEMEVNNPMFEGRDSADEGE